MKKKNKTSSRAKSNRNPNRARNAAPSSQQMARQDHLVDRAAQEIEQLESQSEELKQAEGMLEESRHRFVKIFDEAPIGYVVTDQRGMIRELNLRAAQMLGIGQTEIERFPFARLVAKNDLPLFAKHLQQCKKNNKHLTVELHLSQSNDATFYAHLTTICMRDPRYDAPVFWTAISDASDEERTRLEREFLFAELRAGNDRLAWLSQELLRIQEEERHMLARELHDQVSQNLTALNVSLELVETSLKSKDTGEAHNRLKDTQKLVVETIGQIRNLTMELRPTTIDFYGLAPALEAFSQSFSERTGLRVKLQIDPHMPRLHPNVEIALFRITQEAMTNVLKHAQVSEAEISLQTDPHVVRLRISDQGNGFDSHNISQDTDRRGLGMITMGERARAIGGSFQVVSYPNEGTSIVVEVPR